MSNGNKLEAEIKARTAAGYRYLSVLPMAVCSRYLSPKSYRTAIRPVVKYDSELESCSKKDIWSMLCE